MQSDDNTNVPFCDWDGGDCCNNGNANWNQNCVACECLNPDEGGTGIYCPIRPWKGDGYW